VKKIAWQPLARQDLGGIWRYSASQWGIKQADRYIANIQRDLAKGGTGKFRGLPCDDIKLGYFKIKSGSHIIFFKPSTSHITIVRILHEQMDLESHLS
jgi:toxin ParE1/3/4